MTIKAIETRYKGYRFRSRLEALWAVFFDAAGLQWRYEPEGFETPFGRYLPDFFLPDVREGLWVEVKGQAPSVGELEKLKHVVGGTGCEGVFVRDIPSQDQVIAGPSDFPGAGDWSAWAICRNLARAEAGDIVYVPSFNDCAYVFCVCPATGKVGLEYDGRGGRVTNSGDDKGYSWDHPKLVKAYDAARSARFEHGEAHA